MRENRISPRYHTLGHARIPGVLRDDFLIRNISITGCCLECAGNVSLPKPCEIFKVEVRPEIAARIGKFEFEAECKWVRKNENSSEIGLTVSASPQGKFFQNYVDYIAYYKNNLK